MPLPSPTCKPTALLTSDNAAVATLDHLLVEAAIQCPEADALIGDFGVVSYADFLIRAQNIAVVLKQHGVASGDLVGVAMQQTPVTITALAGVLLAGAACVPLSHHLLGPGAMRKVQASDVSLLLCDVSAMTDDEYAAWKTLGKVLDASRIEQETMPSSQETKLYAAPDHATAAVFFGGDADPDLCGVSISHRRTMQLFAPVSNGDALMRFSARETFLLEPAGPAHAGLFALCGSLLHGASLALAPYSVAHCLLSPSELAACIARYGVSVLALSPARVYACIDQAPQIFNRLRHLLIESDGSGVGVSPQRVEWLQRRHPNLHIVIVYTAPKIAGYATAYQVPQHYLAQSVLPIGCAVGGLRAAILDSVGRPVRPGEMGELAFFAEEVTDSSPMLTGTRARQRTDGLLELHGQADPRIASGIEVAAANGVRQNAAPPTEISDRKPETSFGLERVVLPPKKEGEPSISGERQHEKVLEQVRLLWLRLLHRNSIGYEEDFFEAGGTQVQMIRMHAELNRRFPGSITMGQLSVLRTIRKIFEHLTNEGAQGAEAELIRRGA